MFKLKKTYDREVKELKEKHSREMSKILREKERIAIQRDDEYEENKLLKINLTLSNKENMKFRNKIKKDKESNFKMIVRISNELEEANKKITELENKCKKLEKRKIAFEKLYKKYKKISLQVNSVNIKVMRKLWANKEAQRQLRKLATDEEVNNINKMRKRIEELAMLIGI